jgi:hypothetical protein
MQTCLAENAAALPFGQEAAGFLKMPGSKRLDGD